jgi:hypothetical protein
VLGLPWHALAATAPPAALHLGSAGYFEAPGVNVLVFSDAYDGLFADSKISGVEMIQQGERTATDGDVRLSATPGQWDPTGRLVSRTVDAETSAVTATLEYPDYGFRYTMTTMPRGSAVAISVSLPQALPAALAGKAGFNLEFLPAAYFHKSYMADSVNGTFPVYPDAAMTLKPERNAASGRSDGPGAEPLPMAQAQRFVLAPEEPARRVTVASNTGRIALYDGRNQAQNGWFVLRSLLPSGRTGTVLARTVDANSTPGWLRPPVIAHSQLGYGPDPAKIATVELDRNDRRAAVANSCASPRPAPWRPSRPGRRRPGRLSALPDGGSDYYHPDQANEMDRRAINHGIRAPGHFDGVIDFDAVMRDPADQKRLQKRFDSGDHLHPAPAGYLAMAAAIPLIYSVRPSECV